MDEHELLAFSSEFCCAVVGRGSEYVLVPMTGAAEIEEAVCDEWVRRGFAYCGVLGVIQGRAVVKCADHQSIATVMAASHEFARLVGERIRRQQITSGDWLSWICTLWSLPDTRSDV